MTTITSNTALFAWAIAAVVLSLNILGLWVQSGFVRAMSKTTMNTEDASSVSQGHLWSKPFAEVARVLRAHRNAVDDIIPFLVLGLVFVMLGGSARVMQIAAGVFVVARLAHSVAYVRHVQPYRTLSFAIGLTATVVLTGFTLVQLVQTA